MNKIKAIVFDMDGVLIDAKDWHYDALNMALSQLLLMGSLFKSPLSGLMLNRTGGERRSDFQKV